MTTTLGPVHLQERPTPSAAVVTTDGTAFSWQDVFEGFAPAIESFARSRGVPNPEDVVQEVFATAVEKFPQFEGDSSGLRSFLFTLAYRRVADEHRTAHRRKEQLVADHMPTPDASLGVEESMTHNESAAEAMKALDILGDRERRVIEMRIIDEASIADVAATLGISNGNVRVIQARALVKIRKHLATTSGALRSGGLVFVFLKGLRSELPSGGGLAEWIGTLQSESTQDAATKAAAGAGSAIVAGTTATGTIAGTSLKIGFVVALATASTAAVGSAAVNTGESAEQTLAQTQVSFPATEAVGSEDPFSIPPAVVEEPAPDTGGPSIAPGDPDLNPTTHPDEALIEPAIEDAVSDLPADSNPLSLIDDVADPLVTDVVKTTVEGVVEVVDDVVGEVVEVVDTLVDQVVEVVDTVVDEVVKPVVDDVVAPIVDGATEAVSDTVATVVDDLNPVVDDVDSLVDDITDGLGLGRTGPLGRLLRN